MTAKRIEESELPGGPKRLVKKAKNAGCDILLHSSDGPWMTLEQARTISVSMTRDEAAHRERMLQAQVIYVERPTGWKAELIQQRLATGGLLTLETLSELAL